MFDTLIMKNLKSFVVLFPAAISLFCLFGFQTEVTPQHTPVVLSASTLSQSQINLSWTYPLNDGSFFKIERSKDGIKYSKIAQVKGNQLNYTNTGLTPITKYYYRVSVLKSKNNPSFSNIVAAFTHIKVNKNDWSGFVYPDVDFNDEAADLEGSAIFHKAIPDITRMMKDQCLAVCKELYSDNKDKRNNFTSLHLILQNDPKGIAAKWGDSTSVTIGLSAQYVASFYHKNGNSYQLLLKEIQGILSHEGTHGYQFSPKNCGEYDGKSTNWGLIEGEADGVRAEITNWTPVRYPKKGRNWNSGYETCGFFLSWCKQTKKPTFLIELNHAARDMETFTWEAAFQQILGQNVQEVWDEYQNSIVPAPTNPDR